MGSGGQLLGDPASCALEEETEQRCVDSARTGGSLLGNKRWIKKGWRLICVYVVWTGTFVRDHLYSVLLLCMLSLVHGGHAG